MPDIRHVPPGRAGRLWLLRRLDTARRGVALLDRKLRILRTEQERCRLLQQRTEARWHASVRDAEQWLIRAALMGGQREIRLATPVPEAEVSVTWGAVMSARYPLDAQCHLPEPSGDERRPGTSAIGRAVEAYRNALQAAAAHAAACAASRIIDAEVTETRHRLRALNERWVPRLDEALEELNQRLEETERAETTRLRWAARTGPGGGTR